MVNTRDHRSARKLLVSAWLEESCCAGWMYSTDEAFYVAASYKVEGVSGIIGGLLCYLPTIKQLASSVSLLPRQTFTPRPFFDVSREPLFGC